MFKIWTLKETGTSYNQNSVCSGNLRQNILNKVNKLSKTERA